MTLILNRPWSNIRTAHQLIIHDICAQLFENPTRGSKDKGRTRNTVMQCLTLNYDQGFKIYRAESKAYWTDDQTDNRAKNNMSLHFMGGDLIIFIKLRTRGQHRRWR